MSEWSEEKLRGIFDAIDADGSGRITPKELYELFRIGGHDVCLATCTLLTSLYDGGEGSLDFDGFLGLWHLFLMWSTIFKSYDQDNSGFLEKKEVKVACDEAFPQFIFTEDYIEMLIQKLGKTKSGVLTSDEYLIAFAYIKNSPPPKRSTTKLY